MRRVKTTDALTPSGPQVEHGPGRLLAKAEAPPTFTWVASPTTLTALSTVTLSIMPTAMLQARETCGQAIILRTQVELTSCLTFSLLCLSSSA